MAEIKLLHPYINGSEKEEVRGLKFLDIYKEMQSYNEQGKPIYIKILTGERRGSIGKFIPNKDIIHTVYFSSYDNTYRYIAVATGHMVWDGSKNKIRVHLYARGWDPEYSWLKDYTGSTIFKKFNKKKYKEKVLKSITQTDIDGNVLETGDKVLYVNIRYGLGSHLCRGKITGFDVKISFNNNKKIEKVYTIIKLEGSKEESRIENSNNLILKMEN